MAVTERRYLGINEYLIGQPGSRYKLATPALVLDLDALENNIQFMASYCADQGIALRPHFKTHKSVNIARMQLDAGAIGLCVATVKEIKVLVDNGIDDGIHLTTSLVGAAKIEIFLQLLKKAKRLTTVVDTLTGAKELELMCKQANTKLPVLIDVDLGSMYRSGVACIKDAVELAGYVEQSSAFEYSGIQFYSGIVQHIVSAQDRQAFYGNQLSNLRELVDTLKNENLAPAIISGGGTGTFGIDAQDGLLTENQAGSYCVMDIEYGDVNLLPETAHPFQLALLVQSTVVSNNAKGIATIDAGSKCFAMDGPLPRFADAPLQSACYQNFGDEFGMIVFPDAGLDMSCVKEDAEPYQIFYDAFSHLGGKRHAIEVGKKVELIAPHCDPTVNLHDYYHCVRGDMLVDIWPVDARGHL